MDSRRRLGMPRNLEADSLERENGQLHEKAKEAQGRIRQADALKREAAGLGWQLQKNSKEGEALRGKRGESAEGECQGC
jgi:hypothetical protein